MKIFLWIVIGLIAFPWTVAAFIAARLSRWMAEGMASGSLGRDSAAWPQPEWLPPWIDPVAMQLLQQWLLDSLQTLDTLLPLFGSLLGWMVPLIWLGWGFGMVMLIACGAMLHWLITRSEARNPVPAN